MAILVEGALGGRMSGSTSTAVLADTKYGTVVRDRPQRSRVKSDLQRASEARLRQASLAFGALTRAEGQAWAAFAATLAAPDPRTGRLVAPSGQNVFNRFATKRLQIDPQASLPASPPTWPFFGDATRVGLEPSSPGTPPDPTPSPPQGKGHDLGKEGELAFYADAPNREGVLTELLVQRLASAHRRTYLERYRTGAFVAFAPGSLRATVPCAAGWTAAAIRFVEAATGRTTAIVELGVVRVG